MNDLPFKLGWIPSLPDARDHVFEAAPRTAVLPSAVRLVWVPAALHQAKIGSCVANAIAHAVQYQRIKQRKLHAWSPSRLFLYYNARAMRGWERIDSGCYIRDGIKSIATQGDVNEAEWPYDTARLVERPPQHCYDNALNDQVVRYRRLSGSLDQFKACLAEDQPFVFGFALYENFPWSGDGNVPMPGPSDSMVGGHAMLCVGYDDATRRFEFLNSWGQGWGRKGRGTIPYDYLTNPGLADDFWEITMVE